MKNAYILFSLLICHANTLNTDDRKYLPSDECSIEIVSDILQKKSPDEGFSVGTKVNTSQGYVSIEEIQKHDTIIGYTPQGDLEEKEVIQVFPTLLASHVKFSTDAETILTGSQQKFYCPAENRWIEAKDIIANQVLRKQLAEYIVVSQIETCNQPATMYTLTVQGHTFYVTHDDICVHNSDTMCGYAQIVLQLGFLVCKHPVLELIGQGLNLVRGCTVMHSILNARIQGQRASTIVQINQSQEKIAYEKLRQELEFIKREFQHVVHGLKTLRKLQGADFTYDFLHAFTNPNPAIPLGTISDEEEAYYNDQQRINLSNIRELELYRLEKEIIDLQITLAFHFYTLIDNRNKAVTATKVAFEESCNLAKVWNGNYHSMPIEIAMSHYDKENFVQDFLQDLVGKNRELDLAIEYYKNPNHALVIKRTSNITDFFAQEEKNIVEIERFIQNAQATLSQHKQITEQFFIQHNAPVRYNFSSAAQRKKDKKTKDLIDAKQQRASIVPPQLSNKNNQDKNNDKHPHGKYEDASYHHKNSSGQKSSAPKDGQKALDNSFLVAEKGNTSYQRRIGVSDGQYVVLDQTSEGVFHGHTREWAELTDKMKSILIKEGKVL